MEKCNLNKIAREIRHWTIECIASLGSGHIGGSLSIVDVLTALYFQVMKIDPKNPNKIDRDRLVVSKGHAGPAVYATLAKRGYFDRSELLTLNRFNTNLPSHCDMNKTIGVDMTTGSLGQGISCAVGLALGSKLKKDQAYIYSIVGDGETQEGQVWEAAMFAAQQQLDNLIVFVDFNHLQLDGTYEEINGAGDMSVKWLGFGFDTYSVDGHDIKAIIATIIKAKQVKNRPHVIILKTIKGKGISFVEKALVNNHSMAISKEDLAKAILELAGEENGIS